MAYELVRPWQAYLVSYVTSKTAHRIIKLLLMCGWEGDWKRAEFWICTWLLLTVDVSMFWVRPERESLEFFRSFVSTVSPAALRYFVRSSFFFSSRFLRSSSRRFRRLEFNISSSASRSGKQKKNSNFCEKAQKTFLNFVRVLKTKCTMPKNQSSQYDSKTQKPDVITISFTVEIVTETKYIWNILIRWGANFFLLEPNIVNQSFTSKNCRFLYAHICWSNNFALHFKRKKGEMIRGGPFCRPFFIKVDQIDFLSSPKALKIPCFLPNFLRRRQNFEKIGQKRRF